MCNIIVAERASAAGMRLGFGDFARSGILISISSIAAAMIWLVLMRAMPL